jgi:hypothetical protein
LWFLPWACDEDLDWFRWSARCYNLSTNQGNAFLRLRINILKLRV